MLNGVDLEKLMRNEDTNWASVESATKTFIRQGLAADTAVRIVSSLQPYWVISTHRRP